MFDFAFTVVTASGFEVFKFKATVVELLGLLMSVPASPASPVIFSVLPVAVEDRVGIFRVAILLTPSVNSLPRSRSIVATLSPSMVSVSSVESVRETLAVVPLPKLPVILLVLVTLSIPSLISRSPATVGLNNGSNLRVTSSRPEPAAGLKSITEFSKLINSTFSTLRRVGNIPLL